MFARICDYCHDLAPKHRIVMGKARDGTVVAAELCTDCLKDVKTYIDGAKGIGL